MSFPSGRTVYTFQNISFDRVRADDMTPWFEGELQYTKDPVLGSGGLLTPVYIDVGADVAPPLSFRAHCLNSTDRYNLRHLRGTTGTLSNTRGRSDTVILVKANPIDGLANQLYIDLVFEIIPS